METGCIVCLTSYRPPQESDHLFETTKLWQACRATSAAPRFFDPIAIGPHNEQFVDGSLGASNPVYELWKQAQDVWGSDSLQGRLRSLVSIGTGVSPLNPVANDVWGIVKTLRKMATETEDTAEQFRSDKAYLVAQGRYYRFNVSQGLGDIGLEEWKKKAEVAAATTKYIKSQAVATMMKACADGLAGRNCQFSPHSSTPLYHIPCFP